MTSPSSIVGMGISCAQVLMQSGMPPICAGQYSATAIMSPCASASAQVKSSASLKIVEYDVFISVMPISRQIDTIVDSRMFIVTMSIAPLLGCVPQSGTVDGEIAKPVDGECVPGVEDRDRGGFLDDGWADDAVPGTQRIASIDRRLARA